MTGLRRLTGAWATLLALAIVFAMLSGFLIAGDSGLPFRLESEMLDLRFQPRPPHWQSAPIVIVEIDDRSVGGEDAGDRRADRACAKHDRARFCS